MKKILQKFNQPAHLSKPGKCLIVILYFVLWYSASLLALGVTIGIIAVIVIRFIKKIVLTVRKLHTSDSHDRRVWFRKWLPAFIALGVLTAIIVGICVAETVRANSVKSQIHEYAQQPQKEAELAQEVDTTPKVEQDPRLLIMADQLGIDVSRVNLRYGNPQQLSVNGTTIGTYEHKIDVIDKENDTGNVTIKPSGGNELVPLAHEYMHYVWAKHVFFVNYGEEQRHKLESLLDTTLASSPSMQDRLDWYVNEVPNFDRYSELQSFACAETNPSELPQELNDWCDKWIPNRKLLFE